MMNREDGAMAESLTVEQERSQGTEPDAGAAGLPYLVARILMPLASLKLTVALFAMAIFIIFAGTLAQVDRDVWDAVNNYFRTPLAWIEFQIFFPPSFFPSKPHVPGGFYFPGGWLIGLVMVINLLAAHGLRFKVQTRGMRLSAGLLVIGLGLITTWLVIVSGSNPEGLQANSWIEWTTLWALFKVGVGALWFASLYGWINLSRRAQAEHWESDALWGLRFIKMAAVLLGLLLGWLLYEGDAARLDDSGMRILWQLIKGLVAGLVLLAGSIMVFKKRAGIVLLHGGVLLMMFSELLVGTTAKEGQMHIREGETVNFSQDVRDVELAFIDRTDTKYDDVVAIPRSRLQIGSTISDPLVPCRVKVLQYFRNSALRPIRGPIQNPADAGEGLRVEAVETKPGSGTDAGGKVDVASAYVEFTGNDGSPIGKYLLSAFMDDQTIQVGDKSFDVSLRFKRTYKPYQVTLLDVRKDDYLGTDTPRNYSSEVRLFDEARGIDRNIKIWMNNPLRYAGETFYQSNYNLDASTGTEMTGLQVVTNTGWMIPYVACMIVATGLLAHFLNTLLRFLNRRAQETSRRTPAAAVKKTRKESQAAATPSAPDGWPELAVRYMPVAVVAVFALWLAGHAREPRPGSGAMDLYNFGRIPVVEQGRVKPIDTVARNSLRVISDRQTYEDSDGHRQPAIRWLLDVIAKPDEAEKHAVFRIQNLDIQGIFDLKPRDGFRYSLKELRAKAPEFNEEVEKARKVSPHDLSLFQRKVMELDRRIRAFTLMQASFQALDFPPLPTAEEFRRDRERTAQTIKRLGEMLEASARIDNMLSSMQPPLAVPVTHDSSDPKARSWIPYSTAVADAIRSAVRGEELNPRTDALTSIFQAYGADNSIAFNNEVARYHADLRRDPPEADRGASGTIDLTKAGFEAYFNHLQLPLNAAALYFVGFILACCAWLGWTQPLNRTAFWLLAFTFGVHTIALISRIYISGRPPVTNLYSSAVFIGWAGVLLGLLLESIYRMGVGNVVAGVVGFKTLLISHFLAADGDTFTVLQAVLDTQFWLATHVVCITLGYATTFVAGLLGVMYIVAGVWSPALSPNVAKTLSRMSYGVVCFALFFSFVGTVLGGLWADDSWGRFWGWDPKENGALMIVLWNALVLHARWDGMVGDRGFAVLVTGGNIATSWSWFGVNELGVGLHSYGFTEGVLLALAIFVASQLAVIAMGCAPLTSWRSFRKEEQEAMTPAVG
jgi:ABC-type transport system involved in cytochrome c biogenesis permease subunit